MRFVFGVLMFLIVSVFTEKVWVHRNPRYLTFPMGVGNKIQVIAGFGIPVEVEETSVTFGLIVKTNYGLPTNASQFTQPDVAFQPSDSKMTRWYLYRSLVTALERLSLGGKDCLLRSICEAAVTPLGHNGLAGQLLHVILT
ncbi:hypothetical protein AAG570_003848 [Ranatra chinensis]|uniref:Uncharacterized protein n=1 Tax=Ranatra chinensis TaxID=642074 RepID=A0ABD0Y221_9HEMI